MDLGTEINFDLSFQSHIGSIVSNVHQRVGILFRGFQTREVSFLKKVFITWIRPLLEYNSELWDPTEVNFTDLLENVEWGFTTCVKAISKLTCSERVGIFHLEPLGLRRLRYDLVQYQKTLNNPTPLSPAVYLNCTIHQHPPDNLRQSLLNLFVIPRKYYLVASSLDKLIAGTIRCRLYVMLIHCQHLNLLYFTLICLRF